MIVAYIYLLIFISISALLLSFMFARSLLLKVVLAWFFLLAVGFLGHALILFFCIAFVAVHFRNESDVGKIFLFICLFVAIPVNHHDLLGLGLVFVTYQEVLAVCFLLPVCIASFKPGRKTGLSLIDLLFIVYILYLCLLAFRAYGPASSVVRGFQLMAITLLPYWAITRCLVKREHFEYIFVAIAIGIGLMSVTAVAETLVGWKVYVELVTNLDLQISHVSVRSYRRSGFVRTGGGAAFNSLIYAYLVNISILVVLYMVRLRRISIMASLPFFGVSLLALYFTGSRAGILVLFIAVAMLYSWSLPRALKSFAYFAGFVFALWGLYFVISGQFVALDAEGSFQYRVDLFLNAIDAVAEKPLFGHVDLFDSPAMRRSIQGQGLIDLVNSYIGVVLKTGLIGLFLFLSIIFLALRGLMFIKYNSISEYSPLLLCLLTMTLIYIATTSMIGFVYNFFWILIAIAAAYARVYVPVDRRGTQSISTA